MDSLHSTGFVSKRSIALLAATCVGLLSCIQPCFGAIIKSGDYVVGDGNADALFAVDAVTGEQTRIATLPAPTGIVFDANSDIIVGDSTLNAIYRIDRTTGNQSIISAGGFLNGIHDIVLDNAGNIIVSDPLIPSDPGPPLNAIIRINPITGAQTLVSSDGQFLDLKGIAVLQDGRILVGDGNADALFVVDPLTGAQTMVGTFPAPTGIAIEANGSIILGDSTLEAIFRIDPITFASSMISSGGFLDGLHDLALDLAGNIIVSDPLINPDPTLFGNTIIRIDSITGAQTLVSSGGEFQDLKNIAVANDQVPEPASWTLWLIAVGTLLSTKRWRG